MTKLDLRVGWWQYSSRSRYLEVWDFSRLRELSLGGRFSTEEFVDSTYGVQGTDMPLLETLHIDYNPGGDDYDFVRDCFEEFLEDLGVSGNLKHLKLTTEIISSAVSLEAVGDAVGQSLQSLYMDLPEEVETKFRASSFPQLSRLTLSFHAEDQAEVMHISRAYYEFY